MNKHPYIIMAPPYRNNSAGVRALYELRQHLEDRGYAARITQGDYSPSEDSIVVYPETVHGNPLHGKTVARYVLNTSGLLGGEKEYAKDEIIFTYSKRFFDAPVLTVPVIEDFFKDEGLPRDGGCFWVGKGVDVPMIPETCGMTEITYDWPEDRKELARLFNEKRVFYSYDDCTALVAEARRCGCRVVVVPGEQPGPSYDEMIKDFDAQLDDFIRITQEAVGESVKFAFGAIVNDAYRLNTVLKKSALPGELHVMINPESATKGLNKLLDLMAGQGADVAVLAHQDMHFRQGWLAKVKEQIALLPDSWVCAGVIGKDMEGRMCGNLHDMRIVDHINTTDIHTFPQSAACFDECVIIINMKKGFRFDESLDGFDLYGTLCVLQTWEMGGTAWVIDAFCEHYCMRPFSWWPGDDLKERYKRLYDRYVDKFENIDSTVFVSKPRFETSAA